MKCYKLPPNEHFCLVQWCRTAQTTGAGGSSKAISSGIWITISAQTQSVLHVRLVLQPFEHSSWSEIEFSDIKGHKNVKV